MQKFGKFLILGAVVLLLAIGMFCGVKLGRWTGSSARSYNTPALLTQVKALSELVTIQYVIEKVEVLEIPSENLVGQFIGSQNRMLLLAHGVVKAGINLEQLKPEDIQVQGKSISIKLPDARITDSYLDEKETKVIDRTTGLLAPPAKDLEQLTRRNALDNIQRAARTSGILSEADARAKAQLTAFFTQLGFESVEFR
ncbi:MAG: DUF4230 domain-containing protein [Akkermansiaceae bacterium]|nr:DUF4230 domain-containing protein [Verrucomicrobiales bacterium]